MVRLQNGPLEAQLIPEQGYLLMSFKSGGQEMLTQPSQLIGPHFENRHSATLPQLKDEALWPQLAQLRQEGAHDPFCHGVARYAPWKAQVRENTIQGQLSGKDEWNGQSLASLEGQAFVMNATTSLSPDTLSFQLGVVGDSDSLVGLSCHFALPEDKGHLTSEGREIDLNQTIDTLFHPLVNPLETAIVLETERYTLQIRILCKNVENCWQLKRQPGSSSVTVTPMAAKTPQRPILTVNSITIELRVMHGPS